MFYTQLFNKKAIAKKNPRIINVIEFMTAHTNVPLKTMTDMREHVCKLATEYYQDCYARALIENGGREPKNIKITVSEYVHLLLNIVPLASITPNK